MNPIYGQVGRAVACIVVVLAICSSMPAQTLDGNTRSIKRTKHLAEIVSAPNAAVAVINFGNAHASCADLNDLHINGVGDIRFSHIITDWELRLNIFNPNGTYPFTTGGGAVVTGPQDPARSVTIAAGSTPGAHITSWSANLPITAVIMRVGLTTYVFPYKPFRIMDTDLLTNDANFYLFTSFCFGEPTDPTAGEAAISGRVVDANGFGISKSQLLLVDGETGEAKITLTNPFGYYNFASVQVGRLYILNVSHKRFSFAEPQRVVSLLDNATNLDFIASPYQ